MRLLLIMLVALPLIAQPFQVGEDKEPFGFDRNRFQAPRHLDGYLPLLRSSYEHGGVRYLVTAVGGAYRVEMTNVTKASVEAIWVDQGKTYQSPLSAGQTRTIYPGSSAAQFQAAVGKATAMAAKLVSGGPQVQVPDERLNDVWRTLLAEGVPVAAKRKPTADLQPDALGRELFDGPAAAKAEYASAVRDALVFKEGHDLLLLGGAPAGWFQEGMRIKFERLEGISLDLVSEIGLQKNMEARIATAGLENLVVRFRNPGKKPLSRVEVNGRQHNDFDREGVVRLPGNQKQFTVKVFFD